MACSLTATSYYLDQYQYVQWHLSEGNPLTDYTQISYQSRKFVWKLFNDSNELMDIFYASATISA